MHVRICIIFTMTSIDITKEFKPLTLQRTRFAEMSARCMWLLDDKGIRVGEWTPNMAGALLDHIDVVEAVVGVITVVDIASEFFVHPILSVTIACLCLDLRLPYLMVLFLQSGPKCLILQNGDGTS